MLVLIIVPACPLIPAAKFVKFEKILDIINFGIVTANFRGCNISDNLNYWGGGIAPEPALPHSSFSVTLIVLPGLK